MHSYLLFVPRLVLYLPRYYVRLPGVQFLDNSLSVNMSLWRKENTLRLIEDIHNNPCLWDHTSPIYRLYRFHNEKSKVYDELAKKYSIKASELVKKVQNLKSQFRKEHRKMKEAEKKKKERKWFGYKPMLFLLNNENEEENEKNDTTGEKIQSDMLENSVEPDESVENSCNIDSQSQTATEISVVKTQTSDIGNNTLQCMKTLIDVVTKLDKFSVYGEYIADKLRISGRSKIEIHIAQHHIDNVVFNLVMGVYGRGATGKAGIMNKMEASEVPNFALKEEKM